MKLLKILQSAPGSWFATETNLFLLGSRKKKWRYLHKMSLEVNIQYFCDILPIIDGQTGLWTQPPWQRLKVAIFIIVYWSAVNSSCLVSLDMLKPCFESSREPISAAQHTDLTYQHGSSEEMPLKIPYISLVDTVLSLCASWGVAPSNRWHTTSCKACSLPAVMRVTLVYKVHVYSWIFFYSVSLSLFFGMGLLTSLSLSL